ncbi:hypothetical protein HYX10_00665 [Candidatus Woesearchaeota archaeon]|nr:hypothetical protein [Candidatus Woesearchaeota archaeon]
MGNRKNEEPVSKNITELAILRFMEAPSGKQFVLNDGRLLKNIKELADALEHMSDDVFKHHVAPGKNDFSIWVSEVLQENDLADDLTAVDNQLKAQLAVLKHIAKKAF